jgi:putative aminopeptidase FrvX
MNYLLETLEALVHIPSPTGYTAKAEAYLMEELKKLGYAPWQSNKGTVYVQLNPLAEGEGRILSAHIDTLGLMVRSIKSNGRLRVTTVGGFPLNYAEQECVQIHTRDGKVFEGTLRLNEPAVHASRDIAKAERSDENMEVVIDEKVNTKEETEALGIMAGDYVTLDPRFRKTKSGYIKSRHLDDKASASVLLSLAKSYAEKKWQTARPLFLMFTNYEEVGHGASAAHPEGVTEMIAVDMGVVGDDLTTDETKVSICAKDSTGPYNYALTDALVKVAKENGLQYAVDIYPYYGSDTAAALGAGYDYRHALIGPGVAASHGYERTHVEGLENTKKLLMAFLKE